MNLLLGADHGTTHPKWVQTVIFKRKNEMKKKRKNITNINGCTIHTSIETVALQGLILLNNEIAVWNKR
jgi:hypothetical protein